MLLVTVLWRLVRVGLMLSLAFMRFWVQFLVPGWGGEDVTSGT